MTNQEFKSHLKELAKNYNLNYKSTLSSSVTIDNKKSAIEQYPFYFVITLEKGDENVMIWLNEYSKADDFFSLDTKTRNPLYFKGSCDMTTCGKFEKMLKLYVENYNRNKQFYSKLSL